MLRDSKLLTWGQKKPIVQRRLGFWLISDLFEDKIEETGIKTAIRTDHSEIVISFNSLDEQVHALSNWKMNSSLMEDENYVSTIKRFRNG